MNLRPVPPYNQITAYTNCYGGCSNLNDYSIIPPEIIAQFYKSNNFKFYYYML